MPQDANNYSGAMRSVQARFSGSALVAGGAGSTQELETFSVCHEIPHHNILRRHMRQRIARPSVLRLWEGGVVAERHHQIVSFT